MESNVKCKNYELFLKLSEENSYLIRNELFEKYKYIVEIISKKYSNRGIEYEDIYQTASIGLINAIDRFDAEKGFEFTSFATPTIIGEVKKHFRDKSWTIKVSRRIKELSGKIMTAREVLSQTLGKQPGVEDIAEYLSCSQEEVIEAMEASDNAYTTKSLDATLDNNEDNDINFKDFIGQEDKNFFDLENRDFIESVVKKLNVLEQRILQERYFCNEKTQVQLSKELGISQVTISRLEKKIIDKFRQEYRRSY